MIGRVPRFFATLATWGLVYLAGPGIVGRDGFGLLVLVALVPWALVCSRAGPRALLTEWLAAGIGNALLCSWSRLVWPGTLLFLAIVPGFYMAAAGSLLRLLSRRYPLALAAPVAWVALETLLGRVDPPFGFQWLRLGTSLHATAWISGSARVIGVPGLSFLAAAFAGGIADYLRRRYRRNARARRQSPKWAPVLGALPLCLGIALSLGTHPPATRPGPRVLLVQPAFEQHRKMQPRDWRELAQESVQLTAKGIAAAPDAPPDLVAWGETMFPFPMAEKGLGEAFDRGARPPGWARDQISREWIDGMEAVEKSWIRTQILERTLPAGTSFLAGVEYQALHGGAIRRQNAMVLWRPGGERGGVGGKVHLVPGAEDMCGAERIGFVRAAVEAVAGYVPDLLAFDRTEILELGARDGRTWHFSASVCFDNVYDDAFTAPLRRGDVDFHLVCSNEAWYEKTFEYDQMIAFSRLAAIATGRSVVRATNAGISIVLDPSGREVARLEVPGQGDRMVAGTLAAVVPVPEEGSARERTPFVRFENAWLALWLALPFLLGFLVVRGGYTSVERG